MRQPLEIEKKIEALTESLLKNTDIELFGVKVSSKAAQGKGASHTTVRVYIEKTKEPSDGISGITIDDIAKVSRKIGTHLEVENVFQGHYILEVSSPGLDRVLFKPEHFQAQVGEKLQVSLFYPRENRKNFQGILEKVEKDQIFLRTETSDKKQRIETIETLNFEEIDKARVMPNFKISTTGKGKKGGVEKE